MKAEELEDIQEEELPVAREDAGDTGESDQVTPDFDFDEEEYRLNVKQKIWIVASLVVSFLFFTLLLFPRDIFLRSILSKSAGQVRIDFSSAEPGLFGQTFQSFRLTLPDGTNFISDTLESTLHVHDLIRGVAAGDILMSAADFSSNNIAMHAKTAEVTSNVSGIFDGLTAMRGDVVLKLSGVGFQRLPGGVSAFVPVDAGKIEIGKMELPISFRESGPSLQRGLIVSNLFTIKLEGNGKYQGTNLDTMALVGKICLKPVPKLEELQPELFGMYAFAGGTTNDDLCFNVRGTLGKPEFSK
ncbi:MAG: type II secretion system protein GspN [Spirochaetia bacterium]|nr:type II secretion system protein GspN [Spirochaetia bacterium]